MKKLTTTILILAVIVSIFSCKKKETTTTAVSDAYVGIWHSVDSLFLNGSFNQLQQVNFSISKKDANNVYFLNFNSVDTSIFSVTETSLAYVSGGSGNFATYLSSFIGTRNGNKITFTMHYSNETRNGVATKQ